MKFAKPGDVPLRPQSRGSRGRTRANGGTAAKSKTYGAPTDNCATCGRRLSIYNPDDVCGPCASKKAPS